MTRQMGVMVGAALVVLFGSVSPAPVQADTISAGGSGGTLAALREFAELLGGNTVVLSGGGAVRTRASAGSSSASQPDSGYVR
ncbi:MAG: hypothetical protein ACOY3P_13435, partial [Planctomycetota bacterium]